MTSRPDRHVPFRLGSARRRVERVAAAADAERRGERALLEARAAVGVVARRVGAERRERPTVGRELSAVGDARALARRARRRALRRRARLEDAARVPARAAVRVVGLRVGAVTGARVAQARRLARRARRRALPGVADLEHLARDVAAAAVSPVALDARAIRRAAALGDAADLRARAARAALSGGAFSSGLHAAPQVPQLALSFWRSVQNAPASTWHVCSFVAQTETHAPCEHSSVPLHVLPHAPQFAGSFEVLTHWPLHVVCDAPQPATVWPSHAANTSAAVGAMTMARNASVFFITCTRRNRWCSPSARAAASCSLGNPTWSRSRS